MTPWEAGAAAPPLVDALARGAFPAPPGARLLVPGCGSGADARALAAAGFSVDAEDISPAALAAAAAAGAADARGAAAAAAAGGSVALAARDFFAADAPRGYAGAWDYTFCAALPVAMRGAWAAAMARRLAPRGRLVCLLFPVAAEAGGAGGGDGGGPPFNMAPADIDAELARAGFARAALAPVPPARSHAARAGREWWGEWELR